MEARVAALEAHVEHIREDVRDIKEDIKGLRADHRWLLGGGLAAVVGLASMMAKGFGWLG